MKLYPETQGARLATIAGDVLALVWIAVWFEVADAVRDAVQALAAPARRLQGAGSDLAGSLGDASRKASEVPLVGERLTAPLDQAGRASGEVAQAGAAGAVAVDRLALVLAVVITLLALVPLLTSWLPRRVRWIADASAAARLRSTAEADGLQLLAIRAAARRSLVGVAYGRRVGEPFVVGDADAVAALAAVELQALGLRAPSEGAGLQR